MGARLAAALTGDRRVNTPVGSTTARSRPTKDLRPWESNSTLSTGCITSSTPLSLPRKLSVWPRCLRRLHTAVPKFVTGSR